jgi:hypothetical protein
MFKSYRSLLHIVSFLLIASPAINFCFAATIDKSQAKRDEKNGILWYDAHLLGLEGKGWRDTKTPYVRLPAKAEGVVPAGVWGMSHHPAGLCVRFVTDATTINVRWTPGGLLAMPHMPATSVSGLDLYVKQPDGSWRWVAVAFPSASESTTKNLTANLSPGKHEFLLYLPLHNALTSLEIGLPKDRLLENAGPWGEGNRKPIVFYGTSITQGGCASRPGMAYPAIVQRHLNYPVINLGFSGNGRLDPEVADLLVELDPAVYVLDCLPNMNGELTAARVEPFVKKLRSRHPETPILLVEDCAWPDAFANPTKRASNENNWQALRAAYERLQQANVKNLYYLKGDLLLPPDGEGTVDGTHPTDYGFMHEAGVFEKVLRSILFRE